MDSGPPPAKLGAGAAAAPDAVANGAGRGAAVRRALEARGELAFRAFVRRSDDRRLERTVGSDAGLKVIFGAMRQQYAPERAMGFTGDIVYELRTSGGKLKTWTVTCGAEHATARPGGASDPKLTIKISLADFVRIAGRDLDPGKALIGGKMDLEGDFSVAAKLGEMFGQPSAY
jgi:hypothetical protein